MPVRVGMNNVPVTMFVDMVGARRIKRTVGMVVMLIGQTDVRCGQPQRADPDWQRNKQEQASKKIDAGLKAQCRDGESSQRIGEPPAGMTQGKMCRVDVWPLVKVAVGGETESDRTEAAPDQAHDLCAIKAHEGNVPPKGQPRRLSETLRGHQLFNERWTSSKLRTESALAASLTPLSKPVSSAA